MIIFLLAKIFIIVNYLTAIKLISLYQKVIKPLAVFTRNNNYKYRYLLSLLNII